MSRARVVFNQVLSNSVDEAQFALTFGLQDAANIADAEQLQETLKKLASEELVPVRHAASRCSADLNQAYGLLREALAVDRPQVVKYAQDRLKDLATSVGQDAAGFRGQQSRSEPPQCHAGRADFRYRQQYKTYSPCASASSAIGRRSPTIWRR